MTIIVCRKRCSNNIRIQRYIRCNKKHVDEEDKGVGEIPTPGGKQNMKVINESGLYSLILSSKLPSAQKYLDMHSMYIRKLHNLI